MLKKQCLTSIKQSFINFWPSHNKKWVTENFLMETIQKQRNAKKSWNNLKNLSTMLTNELHDEINSLLELMIATTGRVLYYYCSIDITNYTKYHFPVNINSGNGNKTCWGIVFCITQVFILTTNPLFKWVYYSTNSYKCTILKIPNVCNKYKSL